jgi:hypothetical protein
MFVEWLIVGSLVVVVSHPITSQCEWVLCRLLRTVLCDFAAGFKKVGEPSSFNQRRRSLLFPIPR